MTVRGVLMTCSEMWPCFGACTGDQRVFEYPLGMGL